MRWKRLKITALCQLRMVPLLVLMSVIVTTMQLANGSLIESLFPYKAMKCKLGFKYIMASVVTGKSVHYLEH